MIFKDLHLNRLYTQAKELMCFTGLLLKDKRMRAYVLLISISAILTSISSSLYSFQKNHLNTTISQLDSKTQEILRRNAIKQHQKQIPGFQASMKSVGAYQRPLSGETCLYHVENCFLQKNKPEVGITLAKQEIEPTYTVQSFDIKLKSSFDYEIFDMIEYILSHPNKFGYTRLREFEIEQLFETSPVVKGRFVYDQLSLNP